VTATEAALLVVDDNEDNRYTLRRRLNHEGYKNHGDQRPRGAGPSEALTFRHRRAGGTILGEDNERMSKSRGNVVNPDDIASISRWS
jgi:hypothetical protein